MEKARKIFWQFIKNNNLDLRSLALFRISIASVLLLDLALRAGDIQSFYTDSGVLPRDFFQNIIRIFPHFFSGSFDYQLLLFLVQIIFSIFLLVGFKTRISTIISWFLLVSLITRNPYVSHTGDLLLRTALFWGIFLPLGDKFSLDKLLSHKRENKIYTIFSYATFAFVIQIMAAYLFPGLFKLTVPQWTSGAAMYYSLSSDQWATSVGQYLLSLPILLKIGTISTIFFEIISPLVFLFIKNQKIKLIIVLLLILFHIGHLLNLAIGTFPIIVIAILTALLPSVFWDSIKKKLSRNYSTKKALLPYEQKLPKIANIIIIFALVLVLLSNLAGFFDQRPPQRKELIGSFFNQYIRMFAPPPTLDLWIVIPGNLADERSVNIYNGGPILFDKPQIASGLIRHGFYKNQRWVNFLGKMRFSNPEIIPYYASFLCRNWNNTHFGEERLKSLTIIYMLDLTMPNNQPNVRKEPVIDYKCSD